MVDLLLEAGADVNGTNDQYDHWSPLMLARDQERDDLRDELLRRGARIGLMEALLFGDDARVEELLRPGVAALPAYAPNGGSVLNFARTLLAIDRLMELGVPTGVKDRWGATPIESMSRLGPRGQPLVRHLIARGIPAAPEEYARLGDLPNAGHDGRTGSRRRSVRCGDDGRGGLRAPRARRVAARARRERQRSLDRSVATHGIAFGRVERRSYRWCVCSSAPGRTLPRVTRNTTGRRSGGPRWRST